MFCNNDSVVKSMSRTKVKLSKKHQLISWHSVSDAISYGWLRVLKEPGETKLADIFTKPLPIQRWEDILNSIYSCNDNLSGMNNDTDYHGKLVIRIITDRVDGLISILIIFTKYIYL